MEPQHPRAVPPADDWGILDRASRLAPLPSVHYLRLHAACARVAHKSGAAVYIEALARDLATLSVLAEDGSSAGVLAAALSRIAG
jgi:hypothetical protein